jgi:phage terminase small subunit
MQHAPVLDREGNPTGDYRFDAAGANRALELLGRRLRMWDDKEQPSQPGNQFILNAPPQLLIDLADKIREQDALEADCQHLEE